MQKKENSKLVAKCAANAEDKASIYSLNQIQKRSIERFADKKSKFYNFCLLNGIVETDLRFDKILNFGTERELNTFKQQPDKTWVKGDRKTHFSFWTFQNCLIRYVASKDGKKTGSKPEAKKTTNQAAKPVKTVVIEPKQTAKPEVLKAKKVA